MDFWSFHTKKELPSKGKNGERRRGKKLSCTSWLHKYQTLKGSEDGEEEEEHDIYGNEDDNEDDGGGAEEGDKMKEKKKPFEHFVKFFDLSKVKFKKDDDQANGSM